MGMCWLVGKCGLANGLRSAAGGVDTTRPPALPLHRLSPGCARQLGRSLRPACVCNQEEAVALWRLVLTQRVTCRIKLLPVFLTK